MEHSLHHGEFPVRSSHRPVSPLHCPSWPQVSSTDGRVSACPCPCPCPAPRCGNIPCDCTDNLSSVHRPRMAQPHTASPSKATRPLPGLARQRRLHDMDLSPHRLLRHELEKVRHVRAPGSIPRTSSRVPPARSGPPRAPRPEGGRSQWERRPAWRTRRR